MTMSNEIQALRDRVSAAFPSAETDLEVFPSSAVMLDVRLKKRLFVLAYYPGRGFGVDEVLENEGFNTGYRFVSEDIRLAEQELLRLLRQSNEDQL